MLCDRLGQLLGVVMGEGDIERALQASGLCMMLALIVDCADLEWREGADFRWRQPGLDAQVVDFGQEASSWAAGGFASALNLASSSLRLAFTSSMVMPSMAAMRARATFSAYWRSAN